MMNRKLLITGLLSIVLFACNNTANDAPSENKEKELLEKEIELLKKEKELLEKENKSEQTATTTNGSPSQITSTGKQHVEKNSLITDNSAGIFEIGKSIPFPNSSDTYKITKESQTRMTEEGPYEETVYIVSEKGQELLNLKLEYDHNTGTYTDNIGEIMILSDKYKTKEGVGVNSTVEQFINKYPRFNLWYTYVSGMYVIDSDDIKAQFLLNEKDFMGDLNITSDMTKLKRSDFKNGSIIMKIRVF